MTESAISSVLIAFRRARRAGCCVGSRSNSWTPTARWFSCSSLRPRTYCKFTVFAIALINLYYLFIILLSTVYVQNVQYVVQYCFQSEEDALRAVLYDYEGFCAGVCGARSWPVCTVCCSSSSTAFCGRMRLPTAPAASSPSPRPCRTSILECVSHLVISSFIIYNALNTVMRASEMPVITILKYIQLVKLKLVITCNSVVALLNDFLIRYFSFIQHIISYLFNTGRRYSQNDQPLLLYSAYRYVSFHYSAVSEIQSMNYFYQLIPEIMYPHVVI